MSLRQFDSSGSRLGCLGSDGLLNIWSYVEGKPAQLLQKFSTSSHLAAAPTCLAWAEAGVTTALAAESQHKVTSTLPASIMFHFLKYLFFYQKKKSRGAQLNDTDLVAIGTASGRSQARIDR